MKFTFEEYAKEFNKSMVHRVEDAVDIIRTNVKLHGPRLVQAEIQAVTPRQPVDRSTYKRSWRFEDIPGGAVMYNFSGHASIIEDGRRPGGRMPPLSVIADWVRRKGIGLRAGPVQQVTRVVGGRVITGRRGFNRRSKAELRSIAFVVARAIKARGLPAHHIMRLAGEKLDVIVQGELAKGLGHGAESRE